MTFSFFCVLMALVVGLCVYINVLQGFFSAAITAVLTVIAASLAMGYHERLVEGVIGSMFGDAGQPIALITVFSGTFFILRVLFDKAIPKGVTLPSGIGNFGGGLMGLVTGVFTAGIMAVAAQQMGFFPAILGYARYRVEESRDAIVPVQPKNLDRSVYDYVEAGSFTPETRTMMLVPVDDVMVGAVAKFSDGALSAGRPLTDIHPDYLQELFGQRLGIQPGAKHVAMNLPSKNLQEVVAHPGGDYADAGVYTLDSINQRDGDFQTIRQRKQPLGARFPEKPDPSKMLVIVRTYFKSSAADKGNLVRLSPGAVRLVAKKTDAATGQQAFTNYYPIGTVDDAQMMYAHNIDDFLFINAELKEGGKDAAADFAFYVERKGFLTPGADPKEPGKAKVANGTFLEVKRLAREDLSGMEIKTVLRPNKVVAVVRKPLIANPPPQPEQKPPAAPAG